MEEGLDITVIICTYNRCESLAKALDSVASSILPESVKWEVLVVDNNSKDRTREVIDGYCRLFPGRFRYLFEGRQGKSHALNSGIREAAGEIVAFMDDDVTVAADWLKLITEPLQRVDLVGTGGRILAAQSFTPPRWLALSGPYSMAGMLAMFDLGDHPCQLHEPPFGTNMAFRKSVFVKHGYFRTDMGPCPGSEMRNEDTEFGRRILSAGDRLWYEPSAIVYHNVPEKRLKKDYFLAFWFDHGRVSIREWKDGEPVLGIRREYFWILRLGTALPWLILRWFSAVSSPRRFFHKGVVWMNVGKLSEIRHRLKGSPEARAGDPAPGPEAVRIE